jgi:hypothetical protein
MHNEPLVRSESTRKKAPSRSGVPNYSVVKGHPVEGRVFPPRNPTHDQPHYHIHILGGPGNFDVASTGSRMSRRSLVAGLPTQRK